ncbi:hypothetical protein R3W88_008032 [Solanum pinnatisectum]|uniref:RNase H type-1 domain-containing protein n=1 Tax=Solanum pinnatisectum TaxID=50273 RepID=A0AAV9M7G6_9SOLN|nr:hypothetical protein R3W88_008032 [Solanum pinnatisectum]
MVQWTKPPDKWVKVNTDGSALCNPGRIGAGGIIRNPKGELILAFSTPLGEGTNNQAEVEAAILGLSWCANLRYKNVILEVDSQVFGGWFKNNQEPGICLAKCRSCSTQSLNSITSNAFIPLERPIM